MTRFQVVEIGQGEPRPLLRTGEFAIELASPSTIAEFSSVEIARAAGAAAPNRRPGSTLYVPGAEKYPTARAEGATA